MSILINKDTEVLIQGITGKEGSRACREMLQYGSKVIAGVSPGKGGVETPEAIPVFNSVREAKDTFKEIDASLVVVPPTFATEAVLEAIENNISLINILTEKIPVYDVAKIIASARRKNIRIVGPSSVGILVPGVVKIGSIGSSQIATKIFEPGPIGVVSKSGGMTAEISRVLTENGLGQSTVIGIGGDQLIGSDFSDIVLEFENDPETKAVVIFGEVGGTYEEKLAENIKLGKIKKPVVCLIAGQFAETLPEDSVLGHAGAIVNKGQGSALSKINALQDAGAYIAETPEEIPEIVEKFLL